MKGKNKMAEGRMDFELKKAITPKFRVSYPSVFEAKSFQDQEPKYSLTMLFDKEADLKPLKRAVRNACIEAFPDLEGKKFKDWPRKAKRGFLDTFKDGNEKSDTDGYEDTIFVRTSSKKKPGLINQKRKPITDPEGFYAGCYARAEVAAFWYKVTDKKSGAVVKEGVTLTLLNIQKMGDGEEFSGRVRAEDAFDEVEDQSDVEVEDLDSDEGDDESDGEENPF